MNGTNNKVIAKNAIYMYIRMLVMMLVSLYTTRVVLQTLGVDDYGIYNVVGGIVVFFTFINAGLAGATKRYILAELAVGDLKSQRKVYSIAINAHLLIAGVILIAGETIGLWVLYNALNIPAERMHAASMVYQASLLTAIIGILQSPFSSVIISFEKMAVYAYLSILDVLLKLGIVFLIQIIDGDRLIWYGFLLSVIALLDLSVYYLYCRRKFELCRYVHTHDKGTFKSILQYVGWTVFGTGANVLSNQGVSILINNYFTVAVNAALGVSNMVVNAASQFVNNIQVVFAPQLTKNYISKDNSALLGLVFQSSRYTSFLILIILVPILFVIPDLLKVWLGTYPEYSEEFCVLALICIFIESVSMPLTTIITAEKNIKKYQLCISSLYLLIFLFSWCILLFGILPFEVMYVRAGIGVVMVSVRVWIVKKRIPEFSILKWLWEAYGKSILMGLLSIPLIFILKHIVLYTPLMRLVVLGSICVLWEAIVIYVVGLNKSEKVFVLSKIQNVTL